MLEIRQLELGPLANFIYVLADKETGEALVIDPAWDVASIGKLLDQEGWKLKAAVLTHNHFDHINGLGDILKFADIPIYIHKNDAAEVAKDFAHNLKPISGGETISLGACDFRFLHTPGHTEGSQCLEVNQNLVTGDTLFIGGCGRVDLPNSDPEKMYASLKKIATLDDRITVLPGHNYGPTPTGALSKEKQENPYLQLAAGSSLADFLRVVG